MICLQSLFFFIVLLETGILRFCMIVQFESKLAKKTRKDIFLVVQSLACETCNLFFFPTRTKKNSCGHLSFGVVFSFFSMKEVKKLDQSRPACNLRFCFIFLLETGILRFCMNG